MRRPLAATSYLPAPCVLLPERVTECPHPYDLPDTLRDRLQAWDAWQDIDRPYLRLLSTTPGTKLLGHSNWIQGPRWPVCVCGRRMTHLVTIASAEYGDGDCWNDVPTGSSPHRIMIGDDRRNPDSRARRAVAARREADDVDPAAGSAWRCCGQPHPFGKVKSISLNGRVVPRYLSWSHSVPAVPVVPGQGTGLPTRIMVDAAG